MFPHETGYRSESVNRCTILQDLRRHENQQFRLVGHSPRLPEQCTYKRKVAEERNLGHVLAVLGLVDSAENDGLTIVDQHLGRQGPESQHQP